MARDPDSLRIRKWAGNAPDNRQTPESAGIDRSEGWGPTYSQIGGKKPERKVWNQVLCEQSALGEEVNSGGLPLEWNGTIDYELHAFVRESRVIYWAKVPTGPATDNAERPPGDGSIWQAY